MGEHLLWLLRERYPQRKVIVWAASTHTTVTTRNVVDGSRFHTMGQTVRESLGPAVYNLSFKPYTGLTGNPHFGPNTFSINEYSSDLTDLLHEAQFQQAFIDIRKPPAGGEWLRQPMLLMRPRGQEWRGVLQSEADGIFFIDTERPVTTAAK